MVAGGVSTGTLPTNDIASWVSVLGTVSLAVALDVELMSGCCAAVGAARTSGAADVAGVAVAVADSTAVGGSGVGSCGGGLLPVEASCSGSRSVGVEQEPD